MIRYEKCPRCELNYIDADKQEYCDVCIAELKGNKLQFADIDDDELEEVDEELETEICPICGVNKMRIGETSCEACKKQNEYEEDDDVDIDKDEEWKNYLNDEVDDMDLTIDDDTLREELEADMEDDEDSEENEDEEFYEEEDPLDDFEDLDDLDDDFDDDEDEDEDDEEDDDDF